MGEEVETIWHEIKPTDADELQAGDSQTEVGVGKGGRDQPTTSPRPTARPVIKIGGQDVTTGARPTSRPAQTNERSA